MTFEVPSNPSHSMIPHCTPYPAGYPMSHRTPHVPQGTLHPTLHPRGHPTFCMTPHILQGTPCPTGHPASLSTSHKTPHIPQGTPHPTAQPQPRILLDAPQGTPKPPPKPPQALGGHLRWPTRGSTCAPCATPSFFPLLMRRIWGDTSPPSSGSSPGLCQAAPCRPDSAPGQGLRAKPWRWLSLPC